jgi:hypothetical protein
MGRWLTLTASKALSLLKRSVIGSYRKVSIKYLDAYLDELERRFNDRRNEYIFRATLTKLVNAAKLPIDGVNKGDLVDVGRMHW